MSDRLRLLVIDDDLVDRLAIRRAVEQSGLDADLAEASDAKETFAIVKDRELDCLLLDQDLPGMSGIELARQLREMGNFVPIVFVTGRQDEELLEQAVQVGITDFIPKHDLTPRRLGLRVQFAIRIGRAEAETARALATAPLAARARDEILAVVSHDLPGPVHAIRLACQALRDEGKPS